MKSNKNKVIISVEKFAGMTSSEIVKFIREGNHRYEITGDIPGVDRCIVLKSNIKSNKMKNLLVLAVILSLALMGCEKESMEPEIINNYDTIYVAQEPSEIGVINYSFDFPNVFDTERGLIGVGNNQVTITNNKLRFFATSLNAETNTHVGGSGDFDSIRIDYVDFDNGIVIGTIFGSYNLAGELQVTNGTFKYEDGISFEVSLEANWGTMNLFLYN